jgi:hypothetical protein
VTTLAKRSSRSRVLAISLVAAAALGYPLAVLAGGAPRFPSTRDCDTRATHDGAIDLNLGTFPSAGAAAARLARAQRAGFVSARALLNECGQFDVLVPGYTTLAGAQSAVAEARSAGLPATPQQTP